MKNTDPVMGAKLKSKTHLQGKFFDFESVEKVVKNAHKKSYKLNKFDDHQ